MRVSFRGFLVALIFVLGFGGTVIISNALRDEARSGWEQEAASVARSLTGTLLGWMEESYAPLSGLAAIAANSDELTEAEFLNAYDALEARATAVFLETAGLAVPVSQDRQASWKIEHSSDPLGCLEPETSLNNQPQLLDIAATALDRFGEIILGPPLANSAERSAVSPIALSTYNPSGSVIILGLIDYQALINGLFELHVPEGVSVSITGRFAKADGPGPKVTVLQRYDPTVIHSVPIRTVSAGAELVVSWGFTDAFSGGPNTQLANAMLLFGCGMTIFTVLFTSVLLSQNRTIQRRVDQATAHLNEALSTISSSINYASHIQRSVLPPVGSLDDMFSDHFVIWEPRDVVGGDVYWVRPWGDGSLLILGDCTGHGVPGAFMTLIVTGALDRSLAEVTVGDVAALVQSLHRYMRETLNQNDSDVSTMDGAEIGVCYFGADRDDFEFCGARFSLFISDTDGVREIKGGRKGIGYARLAADQTYKSVIVPASADASYYLTTDGLVDQIGGDDRRCFGRRRLLDILTQAEDLDFVNRKIRLQDALRDYQGENERLDDVAVIGFRISS